VTVPFHLCECTRSHPEARPAQPCSTLLKILQATPCQSLYAHAQPFIQSPHRSHPVLVPVLFKPMLSLSLSHALLLICGHLRTGASQHALAEDTSPEVTQKLFQLNTLAPINLTQALLPHILSPQASSESPEAHTQSPGDAAASQGQCHIVVVSSMAGKVPSPGQSVYSGCKTALMGYFASLGTELAGRYGCVANVSCIA